VGALLAIASSIRDCSRGMTVGSWPRAQGRREPEVHVSFCEQARVGGLEGVRVAVSPSMRRDRWLPLVHAAPELLEE
jgi:hypothetical protein